MPPGYILVSNTSGSSPGDARTLAGNISAALVRMQATPLSLALLGWRLGGLERAQESGHHCESVTQGTIWIVSGIAVTLVSDHVSVAQIFM